MEDRESFLSCWLAQGRAPLQAATGQRHLPLSLLGTETGRSVSQKLGRKIRGKQYMKTMWNPDFTVRGLGLPERGPEGLLVLITWSSPGEGRRPQRGHSGVDAD